MLRACTLIGPGAIRSFRRLASLIIRIVARSGAIHARFRRSVRTTVSGAVRFTSTGVFARFS